MTVKTSAVEIHFGREHHDPTQPIDMRQRFFRLPEQPDPEVLELISSMVIKPEVEIIAGESYVDVQVRLKSPTAWLEDSPVNNTRFIYEALQRSVKVRISA